MTQVGVDPVGKGQLLLKPDRVCCPCNCLNGCESLGPGSFHPGRKNPGFVLQYLRNEAINHSAVNYI